MAEEDKFLMLPPLKREKIKKALNREKKEQLRQSLPVLDRYQIRRHRLPYHEALLADLHDFNYPNSEEFLRYLIENQQYFLIKYTENPDKTPITEDRSILNHLYEAFKNAEEAQQNDDFQDEFNQLVDLGVYYCFDNRIWWWIGEQILLKALELTLDNNENEAKVKFFLGKFYLKQLKHLDDAKNYLEDVAEISLNQQWQLPYEFRERDDDTIYSQTCYLLWVIFMEEAKTENDPQKAIHLCKMAKKMAANACHKLGEIEAMMLIGQKELDSQMTTEAIITFGKVLRMAAQEVYLVAVCEAKLKLALALLLHGYWKPALDELRNLRKFAEDSHLPYYSAQALGYLGEFYLKQHNPKQATPFLLVALKLFSVKKEDVQRQEEIREMAAISCADELLEEYKELVMNFDSNPQCMNKLINWKNAREKFWDGPRGFTLTYEDAIRLIEEEEEQEINNLVYDENIV